LGLYLNKKIRRVIKMRKLNFKETILISRILSDVEINLFVDKFKESIPKIVSQTADIQMINSTLSIDLIAYIVSNLHKAEQSIADLLTSYTGKDLLFMDIDDIVDTFKIIWENGLPTLLNKILKTSDVKKN